MRLYIACILFLLSSWSSANVKINTIENNENYLYVYLNTLPIVDINIVITKGSNSDGKAPGLTNLMLNSLLASEIENRKLISYFEDVGAKLSYSVNKESTSISIRSVNDLNQIEELLKKMNQALFINSIDSELLKLEREKIIRAISESQKKPSSVLETAVSEGLFSGTGLAHLPIGKMEHVKAITNSAILNHRNHIFNLNNLEINIVGDISASQSKSLIHLITNNFSTTKEFETIEYNLNSVKSHTEFDSTQSHLTIVIPAVSRKHDNYHDLMVANYIFGGSGFGSWLMEEIRQKRGLSYSVYSYLSSYQDNGYLKISLQTKNENIELAKNIINQQINRLQEFDVEDSIIETTKDSIKRSFEMRVDTNKKILNLVSAVNSFDLNLNYFEDYLDKLSKVNKSSIKIALKNSIHFNDTSIFTVGKTVEQ